MEKIKQRKSLANKLIAMLIVFCILFAHCAVAGTNIVMAVSDELENQMTIQKGENIEFDAYFGDNGIQHSKEVNILDREILYLKVQVKDKFSVPKATIKIEDPNFVIDKDSFKENRYVKNINADTNEIELANISSNNTALIEIPIKFKKAEDFSSDYFSKEVEIKLTGSYKNTRQKEKELEGSVKVKPIWISTPDGDISQEIEKYFYIEKKGNVTGTILQQKIKTEIRNNLVPRKTEVVQVEAPKIKETYPEEVKVLIDGERTDDSNVKYDKSKGTVVVTYNNDDNKISWKEKDNVKEYTLVYKYNDCSIEENQTATLNTRTISTLYTSKENVVKEDKATVELKQNGQIVSVDTKLSGGIYKGYLLTNEDKTVSFTEKNEITVSYKDDIGNMVLEPGAYSFFTEGAGVFNPEIITYKSTNINKDELVKLLGEQGKITIKNENDEVIKEITKDTEADNRGQIRVEYDKGVKNLKFETTPPQTEGKLTISNVKELNGASNLSKEYVKHILSMNVTPKLKTDLSDSESSADLNLLDPKTEVTLELDKTSLSTAQDKENVTLKATLVSNQARYDVYKNPSIRIEFPEDVESAEIKEVSTVYGDEFKVKSQRVAQENGKMVIYVDLEGEQTEHKGSGVKGTVVNINTDLKLKKKAITKDSVITMTYTNENATRYNKNEPQGTTEVKVQIVSPKAMVTTNNIPELEIATYGEEKGVTKSIKEKTNQQLLTIESEIVNNNPTEISNVKIMGTVGTKGTIEDGKEKYENTIASSLASELAVENIDMNKVRIYYTENAQATDDIEDANNRWQPTVGNAGAVKKYLVQISNMAIGEGVKTSYKLAIPENLDYDNQMRQGYTVKYSDNQIAGEHEVKATTIELKTPSAPKVSATLTGEIGDQEIQNGTQVKKNEIIKYNVEVNNEGEEDVENVKVTVDAPTGAKLVNKENANYTVIDDKTISIDVGTLKAKETKTVNVYATPDEQAQEGTEITAVAKVLFNEYEVVSNELKAIVGQTQEMTVFIAHDDDESIEYRKDSTFKANMIVKNMSNNELKNLEVNWNTPQELELLNNALYGDFETENKSTLTITSLKPGETKVVTGTFKVKANSNKEVVMAGSVKCGGATYHATITTVKLKETKEYEFKMASETENRYVNPEDIVLYNIEVKNNNDFASQGLRVKATIPNQFTITNIGVANSKNETIKPNGNNIDTSITLDKGETKTIVIEAKVNQQENLTQDIEVKAEASLEEYGKVIKTAKEIKNKMNATVTDGTAKIAIAGLAWRDINANASKDDFENTIPNTRVRLLDVETNEFVKDENGKELESYTDDTGEYKFEGIDTGDYVVVFDYDAKQYKISDYEKEGADKNDSSKAISRKLDVEGEDKDKNYAVTDIISVNENSQVTNVNLGLEETPKFDLELDKYVSKVTVNNQDGVKTYNFGKESLAKVELDSKKMNGSTVVIEYNIEVSNTGESAGYAKTIEDEMPTDLTFASEMNKDWYQSGSVVRTNILDNQEIQPGETKTLKLILTKTMTDSNTGIITNNAEITESYSKNGTIDIDSAPGNGEQSEDDYGTADTIISVKTGAATVYTTLILIIVSMIGIGVFFIKKETVEVNEDIFKGL